MKLDEENKIKYPKFKRSIFSEAGEGQFFWPAQEAGVWSLQPLEVGQHMSLARALPGSTITNMQT